MSHVKHVLQIASDYENDCMQNLSKFARIRKIPGGKYRVLSQKGKNLGTSDTKGEAVKRLRQVEYFKHQDQHKSEDEESVIDLTGTTDFSYSAMCREIRQHASKEQTVEFLSLFKKEFDKAVKENLQNPEKIALQNALTRFSKKYNVKLSKKLVKSAALLSELGDAAQVGKYLADIVRFTLMRVPLEKRTNALNSLRQKFYSFNADEISQKELPPTSAIGQSITFVKHVLFNHDSHYIREVLNNIVSNL